MKSWKWWYMALILVVLLLIGSVMGISLDVALSGIFTFVTIYVLPWIFLYWFARFVKAYERKNT